MDKSNNITFTSHHIESFFGINRKRLYYWRKIGLLSELIETEGGHYRYTFKDLVAIKTVLRIREEGISTNKIKKVVERLKDKKPDLKVPLAEKSFYVLGKNVYVMGKTANYDPLTEQCTYIKNRDSIKSVYDITINKFDIPPIAKTTNQMVIAL